jgi:hypothetical protein
MCVVCCVNALASDEDGAHGEEDGGKRAEEAVGRSNRGKRRMGEATAMGVCTREVRVAVQVEEDGEGRHGGRVRDEEGRQEQVPLFNHAHDASGYRHSGLHVNNPFTPSQSPHIDGN